MEPTAATTSPDVQASAPSLHVSLSSVGVTGVEKVIRIGPPGSEQLYSARLECFVDLGPRQKGAHMSRFEEVVNDAIGEVDPRRERLQGRGAGAARSPSACASARTRCAPR